METLYLQSFRFNFVILKMDKIIQNNNLQFQPTDENKSSYSHRICDKVDEGIRTRIISAHKTASSIATLSNFKNLPKSTMSNILSKFRKGGSVEKKKEWWNKPIKVIPYIKKISETLMRNLQFI
ncbi:hypothetical protein RF11_00959 [Thelohanellus kitauei]|uniref:Uncharacterized protein n=1 Tax=Thelohanellus kitauei TaxID=669202 RepID=A0A0C2IBY9_THEKT|nr:hypothetical protein RF11_00959 [Thelohanellus kitauei]